MKNKKILIITYYWPPAGGPGVQRWLKFSKYLPEFGWEPIIYTPENPSYPIIDKTLVQEVPQNLTILKRKIWEPYQIAEKFGKQNKKFKAGQFDVAEHQNWKSKLSIFIRGNFFIPDARVFWVKPSVNFLENYLRENHIDALVTTGPPHSLHLIGLQLKKIFPHLKWIADFRDPWTEISYYKHLKLTKGADQKHRHLETKVFQNADVTLATSYTDAENFKKKGANAFCVTNGFDTENKKENSTITRNEKFILSYVGVLEQLRNPEILWETLEEICDENPEFKSQFQLNFAGKLDDKIFQKLEKSSLQKHLNILGYLSHEDAYQIMQNSNLLLLTNFPQESSKGIIPGKIFEYLSTGNPILSFGPKDSDVQKILSETNSGAHFTYSEKELLKKYILQQFSERNTNEKNLNEITQFSRRNLTQQLSELL